MSLQTFSILPHRVTLTHRREGGRQSETRSTRSSKASRGPTTRRQPAIRVTDGRAGDHLSIHSLLLSLLHGPSEAEFQLNLDRPDYDPSQRLLLWIGDDLIGHIRLTPRMLRLHHSWLPTCDLSEFALLPEFSVDEHRIRLLCAAEQHALDLGAVLLTSRTHGDSVAKNSGWLANGDVRCLGASPRDLLANCAAQLEGCHETAALQVRPWRYVEQQALAELYDENVIACDGAPLRDNDYWHWLLVRRGYDEILVVTTKSEIDVEGQESGRDADILGYAFVRGNDIVELMVKSERPDAAIRLVQRIAADAIERDDHRVRVYQPPIENESSAVVRRLLDSESTDLQIAQSVQAAFVVDPCALVELICLQTPVEVAKELGDIKLGLKLGQDAMVIQSRGQGGLRVSPQKAVRSQIATSRAQVTSLLLGGALADPGMPADIRCSSSIRELAARLFQPVTLWRSTLDDLPSSN